MKTALINGYGGRALLTLLLGLLLSAALIHRKVLPSWEAWQRTAHTAQRDPILERSSLEQELQQINTQAALGGAGWDPVITHLSSGIAGNGVSLVAVDPEHVWPLEGLHQHLLPLRLSGSTAALLNTIATLDPAVHGAEVVSLDMKADQKGFEGPRSLAATLYLRSLRP